QRPLSGLHSFPTRRSSDLGLVFDEDGRLCHASRDSGRGGATEKRAKPSPNAPSRATAGTLDGSEAGGILSRARGASPAPMSRPGDRKSTRLNSSHVSISYA